VISVLGKDVFATDVRSALASGDMGFLYSFTTGTTVRAWSPAVVLAAV
jgi:hypothetical protein